MYKNTLSIDKEDFRRLLNLGPNYTVTNVSVEDKEIKVEVESQVPVGYVKRIPGEEYNLLLKVINKAMEQGKEITFSYYNPNKDSIEITSRKFLPQTWINQDCIEGLDLDKKENRRFCPSRMNWVEVYC